MSATHPLVIFKFQFLWKIAFSHLDASYRIALNSLLNFPIRKGNSLKSKTLRIMLSGRIKKNMQIGLTTGVRDPKDL